MKKSFRIFALTLCMVFVLSSFALAASSKSWKNPFTDISQSDSCYGAVKYVYEKGIMNGTSDTTFAPSSTVTRAMISTILWRIAGEPKVTGSSGFTDVADGKWFSDPIAWAAKNGILEGYGDGCFGPDDEVTIEQMIVIFWRYKGSPVSAVSSVGDRASSWARQAVDWAYSQHLMDSTALASPGKDALRSEIALFIYRFCQL